jgi:hypothetical protein
LRFLQPMTPDFHILQKISKGIFNNQFKKMDNQADFSRQILFLRKIEELIPAGNSLAAELTDVLGISPDSVYRRLRAETKLSIDEVILLCKHFKISFDSFIHLETGTVTFNYTLMREGESGFLNYLKSLLRDMEIIRQSKGKHIWYACEDIPIFYNINFPKIAAFKMFYWLRSILNVPALNKASFSEEHIPEEMITLGKQIYSLYCQIPSTEIWSDTTIESTLKQIRFYHASGIFKTNEDAIDVYMALRDELEVILHQAENGRKDPSHGKFAAEPVLYELYASEIELTNNCVLVKLGETKAVYLGHLTFNTMSTSNRTYCEETEIWMNNLIRKSNPISGVSEKNRYQFFKKAFDAIDHEILLIRKRE